MAVSGEGRFFEPGPDGQRHARVADRVALVVGNGAYGGGPLANARADARLVAGALEAIGFDTELLEDAGKAALETAIVRLGERLEKTGPSGFGFFYFAGHGLQHQATNYILPVDAELPDLRYLRAGGVPVDIVVEEMARGGPDKAAVVVLDACRDNRLADATGGFARGLTAMRDLPSGAIVAFATAADQVADDGAGNNGPYAVALARRLTEKERRLDELFFVIARDVEEATGRAQRPALFVQGAPPRLWLDPTAPHEPETAVDRPANADNRLDRTQQPALEKRRWPGPSKARALVLAVLAGAALAGVYALSRPSPPPPAPLRAETLGVFNTSPWRVMRIFARPSGVTELGEDYAGDGFLDVGLVGVYSLRPADRGGCLFDLHVEYEERDLAPRRVIEERRGLDLCRNPVVTLDGRSHRVEG